MLYASIAKINYHYADPENMFQYYATSIVLYCGTLITETAVMPIAVKSVPPQLAVGYWSAFMCLNLADKFGRMFGNCFFTIYSYFDVEKGAMAEPFYASVINSGLLGAVLVVTVAIGMKFKKHMEIDLMFRTGNGKLIR